MVKELLKEHNEHKEEEKEEEEDEEDEDVEKSVSTVLDQLQAIVDSQQTLIDTQKAIGESVIELADRVKALETPTNLPLSPSGSKGEDIGAKVTVPDKYQSNSVQAGLDDDGKGHEKDEGNLKMQQKAQPVNKANFDFTTETPRPNAAGEVTKSYSQDYSPILKDARESGDLSQVARNILAGKYYVPSVDEVGF